MRHRPTTQQASRHNFLGRFSTSAIMKLLVAALCVSLMVVVVTARIGPHSSGLIKPLQHESYMEVLDADARIFLWHRFLSEEECDYLRLKAEKRLERSGVVDSNTGGSEVSDVRTSHGMFFSRAEDAIIEAIERRIAEWTLTPVEWGEGLQVLRYQQKQKYDAHWDWFFDSTNTQNGGNRYATVLMYLADEIPEGGETVFPKLPAPNGINPAWSDCAKYNLAVKPKKGDAILFHSMKTDGTFEERSMHGACPVIRGEKWSMTKWIHAGHYRMGDKYDDAADEAAQKLADFKAAHDKDL